MRRMALAVLLLVVSGACREPVATTAAYGHGEPSGDAERGRQLFTRYGCNVCHLVPGVTGAQGMLGPSLDGVASRGLISLGTIENTPANLARFIQSPGALNPKSTMPPMGITPAEATDIAAYLGTLR